MELRSLLRPVLLASIGTLFFGCSTDLDVTAPYKEITVVYSLLNKNDDIHWVKINKAFLGDGDAFVYAQVPDSTEYSEEEMPDSINGSLVRRIERVDENGNVVATLALRDTILDGRLDGLFNGPLHKMYYFRGDLPGGRLAYEGRYRLVAIAKGNKVEAITPIVNDLTVYTPTANPSTELALKQSNSYQSVPIKWFTTSNGRRYEAYYRFHYDEITTDGVIHPKFFDTFVGSVISSGGPGQSDEVSLNGELFYQTVANRVPQLAEADVQQRIFRGVEFYWWIAAADLHTYLQLANPISGIVEERPDYSNITGGYGLMSSRMFRLVPDGGARKTFNPQSRDELTGGAYTGGLDFCVPVPLTGPC